MAFVRSRVDDGLQNSEVVEVFASTKVAMSSPASQSTSCLTRRSSSCSTRHLYNLRVDADLDSRAWTCKLLRRTRHLRQPSRASRRQDAEGPQSWPQTRPQRI